MVQDISTNFFEQFRHSLLDKYRLVRMSNRKEIITDN